MTMPGMGLGTTTLSSDFLIDGFNLRVSEILDAQNFAVTSLEPA